MATDTNNSSSLLGAGIGAGAGILGSLLTLKSQQDLLDERLRDRRGAELATRQAADAQQRAVVSAAQQSQGGVGLLQGLRAADQMQRRSLGDVQQAKMMDLQRQDAFDAEQRARREKLGAGIGGALSAAGATLATAFPADNGSPETPGQPTGTQPLTTATGALGGRTEALSGGPLPGANALSAPRQPSVIATPSLQSQNVTGMGIGTSPVAQTLQAQQQPSDTLGQELNQAGITGEPVSDEELLALTPQPTRRTSATNRVEQEQGTPPASQVPMTAEDRAFVKDTDTQGVSSEDAFADEFVRKRVGDMGGKKPLVAAKGFTGSAIDFDGNVYPGVNPETMEIEDFRAYGTARATSNDAKSLENYLAPDEAAMIAVAYPTGSGEMWAEYIEANPGSKEALLADLKAKAAEARKRLAGKLREKTPDTGSNSIAAGAGMSGER